MDLPTFFGTTHVIMAGDVNKPRLLLFHGAGDSAAFMWMMNAAELTKDFRIIAIDTMGSSGKSLPNDKYKKEFDLVKWYGEILSGLKITRTYVAGVSYGAYHCQLMMVSFPQAHEVLEKFKLNYKLFPGVGHGLNQIKAREVAAEIREFLLG